MTVRAARKTSRPRAVRAEQPLHLISQHFHEPVEYVAGHDIKIGAARRTKVIQQKTQVRKLRGPSRKPESLVQKEFITNAGISCGPEERMKLEALAKKSEFRLLRKLRELGTLKYHDGSGQLRVEITVPVIAVALLFAFVIGLCGYAVWLSIKEELWGRGSWQRVAWGGGFSLAAATFMYFAYVVFYPLAHVPKIKKLLSKEAVPLEGF